MSVDGTSWKDRIHRVDFSVNEEFEITEWYHGLTVEWYEIIEELVDSGWAVKVTPPSGNDNYWVTASCKVKKHSYDGHSFTVAYPDFATAIILIYYVVTIMLDQQGREFGSVGGSRAWLK